MTNAPVTAIPTRTKARDEIAASVRAHLAVRQISDSELARRTNMSQTQMTRRTNGRLPLNSDELGAIAAALDLTVVELIQMPKADMVGGGSTFLGVTPIHRGWTRMVGPEGLEPPTSSVEGSEVHRAESGEVIQGPWAQDAG